MRTVALRGLLARKTRLALTALAIALGVTLMAGTYVFTDTINRSFDRIFAASYARTDVVLSPESDIGGDELQPPAMDASVLTRVRDLPGVAQAEGTIFDQSATILDKDGDPISRGAPNFVAGAHDIERFEGFTYARGRPPRAAGEVALDSSTAKRKGFAVGDRIAIQAEAPKKAYTIVGLTRIAGVDSFGGATIALMTVPEAQRMTGKQGRYDEIDLASDGTLSAQDLRDRVREVVSGPIDVRTGDQEASSQSADIRDNLGFLQTALLAFSAISLFVGAFIIFNTFSITVAQRAREFALLRTLGASRGQVLRSVLGEGLVLGAVGSAVGLGLGILVASGLRALFKLVGFDLPSTGTVILVRTVIVSLLVGTIVTLVASLAPALRATRVAPVAALREGVALPETRASRLVLPAGVLLGVVGIVGMVVGLLVDDSTVALSLVGAGAVATFMGVALLSPRLVGPLAGLVGAPIQRVSGFSGRLARANSVRQPGRTAVTAAALMIGVALVTFASIFAAGASKTLSDAVDNGLRGEIVVQNQDGFSPFSAAATQAIARADGVDRVAAVRFVQGRVRSVSGETSMTGVDPETFTTLYRSDWKQGDDSVLRRLDERTAVVSKGYADKHDTAVGDALRIRTPTQRAVTVRVTGIIDDRGRLTNDLVLSNRLVAGAFGSTKDGLALVGLSDGADPRAVKRRLDAALEREFPQAQALTAEEFKDDQAGQIKQLLGLIYALLALAIVVSLFGIVNTLALSITERTRELGMLRAVGTSRRQVKRMIRWEAVITALIGAILGLGVGVVLAVLVTRTIDDFALAVPIASLALLLVLAGLAGVLASVAPARRAARLDILQALAHE